MGAGNSSENPLRTPRVQLGDGCFQLPALNSQEKRIMVCNSKPAWAGGHSQSTKGHRSPRLRITFRVKAPRPAHVQRGNVPELYIFQSLNELWVTVKDSTFGGGATVSTGIDSFPKEGSREQENRSSP